MGMVVGRVGRNSWGVDIGHLFEERWIVKGMQVRVR